MKGNEAGTVMSKVMIAFDVETTGRNAEADQIIEISMCLYESGQERSYHRLIKPDVPITPGAERVHGITMEDLNDAPSFKDVGPEILDFLNAADVIVGYNVRFDIRFVEKEFARIGTEVRLDEKLVVDPLRIWQAMEPRRLEDAHRRFVGSEMENAHSAEADVQAAVRVLRGVREAFNLQEADWDDLARLTTPEKEFWIGPGSHFHWEEDRVIFGFGKYSGRPILEIAASDPGYLSWIMKADFPKHVQNLCKGALAGYPESDYNARIAQAFGPPPVSASPA
jgi:DNA polymerase-3 subunit epsilon